MAARSVQLRVGGQTYRVVSTASEAELQRLAAAVDEKLTKMSTPGRAVAPQSILLAAIALAHDLEEEQARSLAFKARARGAFHRLLARVNSALDTVPEFPGDP